MVGVGLVSHIWLGPYTHCLETHNQSFLTRAAYMGPSVNHMHRPKQCWKANVRLLQKTSFVYSLQCILIHPDLQDIQGLVHFCDYFYLSLIFESSFDITPRRCLWCNLSYSVHCIHKSVCILLFSFKRMFLSFFTGNGQVKSLHILQKLMH